MLNSNRANNPNIPGNSLLGEQTTPMRPKSYEMALGHLIIIICMIILLILVSFTLGVIVGKHSVHNLQSGKVDGTVRLALLADRIGDRLIEVRDPNLSNTILGKRCQVLMARLTELENPLSQEEKEEHA